MMSARQTLRCLRKAGKGSSNFGQSLLNGPILGGVGQQCLQGSHGDLELALTLGSRSGCIPPRPPEVDLGLVHQVAHIARVRGDGLGGTVCLAVEL